MKKRILGAMFALFATGMFFAQDDMPISKKDMPSSVQRNVTRYFGKKNISSIIKDKEDGKSFMKFLSMMVQKQNLAVMEVS